MTRHAVLGGGYLPCKHCREEKPLEDFYRREANGNYGSLCKACVGVQTKLRRLAKPTARRDADYRHKYGITYQDYAERVMAQGGCCAVCEQPSILVVDHDHETGLVRGLLCSPCNIAIGHFKNSPERMERGADYIRHSNN